MRALRFRKDSGCVLEVVQFGNGKVVACWQAPVPEVAVYDSMDQFMAARSPDRGYRVTDNVAVAFDKAHTPDDGSHRPERYPRGRT